MQRPEPSEYHEFYGPYIDAVPAGDILEHLDQGVRRTLEVLGGLPAEWETFRYEPGKWTVREIVGHVTDAERMYSYRALSVARRDPATLPSMDRDLWLANSNAGSRPLPSLLEDFERARRSSIALFDSFDDDMWLHRGRASAFEFTVRAFAYIIAGHEIHHRRVLEERYLKPLRERGS